MPPQLADIHITLIPKKAEPKHPNDFRCISLTNIRYKIIVKILVQQLTPILTSYISKSQNAFLPNCHIHHVVGIVQEVTNTFRNRTLHHHYMGLKLDFQ